MGIDTPQDFSKRLSQERRRLADSDSVHEPDRVAFERWLRRKDGTVETSTLETYLRRLRLASEACSIPITELDADSFHDLRFKMRQELEYANSTISNYESALFSFLNDVQDGDWISDIDRTSAGPGGVSADDILEPVDISELIAAANHQRDVAIIEFLADTGARISLTLSLRVKDLDLSGNPTYRPNPNAEGLKGATITDYPLIDSAAAIRSYLRASHPRPDNPDVALFHKLKPASRTADQRWSDSGEVRPNALRQQLSRIAESADVEKPVNPHAFRHAAITRMIREGYTRSQIEHRVHWSVDTSMWETYEHVTGREHTDDIFRETGLATGDGPTKQRKNCGTCGESVAPRHDFCPNCGAATTAAAEARLDNTRSSVMEELVESTDASTRRELRELLDAIDEAPDLADQSDPS